MSDQIIHADQRPSTISQEDREQEIAILICRARGGDPFQLTYHTIEPGVMEPYGDAWCHYIPEARAVLAWHDAKVAEIVSGEGV